MVWCGVLCVRFIEANPRVFTLVHVVSASPTSTDIREVLIRICRELKARFPFIEWDLVSAAPCRTSARACAACPVVTPLSGR